MKYRFHPDAEAELHEAVDYYDACEEGLGLEFAKAASWRHEAARPDILDGCRIQAPCGPWRFSVCPLAFSAATSSSEASSNQFG
jgi:hypothetical protein